MEEKLQVPENIALRKELWRGVGKSELVAILASAALAAILAFTICTIISSEVTAIVVMLAGVCGLAVASGLFTKIEGNQSIFDIMRRQARYKREQQTFYYVRTPKEVYRIEPQEKAS